MTAEQLVNLAQKHGLNARTLAPLLGLHPDRLNNGGLPEVVNLALEDDDSQWIEDIITRQPVPPLWIIQDWTGTHKFHTHTFKTFECGWEFIRTQFPDDEEQWGEFYVVPKTKNK